MKRFAAVLFFFIAFLYNGYARADAAAAVVLALTLLWGGLDFSMRTASQSIQDPDPSPTLSERFSSWSEHWNSAMDTVFDRLNGLWP